MSVINTMSLSLRHHSTHSVAFLWYSEEEPLPLMDGSLCKRKVLEVEESNRIQHSEWLLMQ